MSNLSNNIIVDKGAQKVPVLSPRTFLSCFATHDETIKYKIDSEMTNKRQLSSGRKGYNIKRYANNTTLKNYLNFKSKGKKKISKRNKYSTKLWARSDRGSSLNKVSVKNYNALFIPTKKLKVKHKDSSITTHTLMSGEKLLVVYSNFINRSPPQQTCFSLRVQHPAGECNKVPFSENQREKKVQSFSQGLFFPRTKVIYSTIWQNNI